MDVDRLHPGLRRTPAPGRTPRRLPGSQTDVHHQPDRLCGCLHPGRSGAELGHAVRCPRAARGLRGHHGPCCPVPPHRGLHRAKGAGPRLRRLRQHRGRRSRHRPHPRRRPDPVRVMALDPADQRPHRHRDGYRRNTLHHREQEPRSSRVRHPGRGHGHRGTPRARLRLHQGGAGRMGVDADARPLRHRRGPAHAVRAHRAAGLRTRCCRCGSFSTGTGEAPSYRRSSWERPCWGPSSH